MPGRGSVFQPGGLEFVAVCVVCGDDGVSSETSQVEEGRVLLATRLKIRGRPAPGRGIGLGLPVCSSRVVLTRHALFILLEAAFGCVFFGFLC